MESIIFTADTLELLNRKLNAFISEFCEKIHGISHASTIIEAYKASSQNIETARKIEYSVILIYT